MTQKESRKKWIGLVQVLQRPDANILKDDRAGAYTNAIVFAANYDEAISIIKTELDTLGLDLGEVEDLEPLDDRLRNREIHESLVEIANQITSQKIIGFGSFHTYPKEEK